MNEVDLRELAIDRDAGPSTLGARPLTARRQVLTRFVLPLMLIFGFLALVGWASRDIVFPPRPVTVVPVFSTSAEVHQEGTPLFKAAGWIEPRPTPIRVAALAPGVVQRLLVVEDQSVRCGEPVAELVRDDAVLAHEAALADLELRQAELDEAKAEFAAAETRFRQPVHLEAVLSEAEASLAKIRTELKNLPFAVRRAESDQSAMTQDYEGKQSASGVVAAVEIDIAKSRAESAVALVEELRDRSGSLNNEQAALTQRRDALQTQLELLADETKAKDQAEARIKAANARVAQTRVAVAEAKLRLDRMTIVAPVDGRVFRLIAHPGARIGSGMTQMSGHDGSTVVTMYRPEMLQVRVDTRFEDLPKVSLGQPVEIDNPALSSPLTGKVLFISSEADIQKNTLQVKVEIPNPPPVFKPEMLVDVTFLSQALKDPSGKSQESSGKGQEIARIYVPRQLIQDNDSGTPYVWLADQSANVARKQVVLISSQGADQLVEVTQGLNISSRIIFNSDGLTDGCRIRITGEEPNTDVSRPLSHPGS
jgi:HlyD family secretion protein